MTDDAKKTYHPLDGLRRLTALMRGKIRDAGETIQLPPPTDVPVVTIKAAPCVVLLRALTDGHAGKGWSSVPDDFHALTSAAAIEAHVRADGAVYVGAYQVQGHPDSVVLVYGDPSMTPQQAERYSITERPELERRHRQMLLGVFAHVPTHLPREPRIVS